MAIDFKGIGEGFKDWKTGNLIVAAIVVLAIYFNEDISEYFDELRMKETKIESRDDFLNFTQKAQAVDYNMEVLREELGADRVTLIRFHNGVKFKDGEHFEKFSITQMVENKYIKTMDVTPWQNVPLHLHSWYFEKIIKGECRYFNVNDVEDFSTRNSLKAYGVKSHVAVPLYTKDGVVGVMTINWILSKPDPAKILRHYRMSEWESKELFEKLESECQDIYDLNLNE